MVYHREDKRVPSYARGYNWYRVIYKGVTR